MFSDKICESFQKNFEQLLLEIDVLKIAENLPKKIVKQCPLL